MPRIVAFGCSYTYGQALPDCYENNQAGPNPSNVAWPKLLANKLNYDCVNCGVPGYSNLAILTSILNFKFEPNDICLIMWSFKTRDMIFQPSGENNHLGRWNKEWLAKQDMYHMTIKSWLHMHHAQSYLQSKGITFYAMDVDYFKWHEHDKLLPRWARSVNLLDINFRGIETAHPRALDNMHPGEGFHQSVSEILYETINGDLNESSKAR